MILDDTGAFKQGYFATLLLELLTATNRYLALSLFPDELQRNSPFFPTPNGTLS